MKLIRLLIMICFFVAAQSPYAPSQVAVEQKQIDWHRLSPKAIDTAYDWVDALSSAASTVKESDTVFAPRMYDADKLMRVLQRISDNGSPADGRIFRIVQDTFAWKVSECRLVVMQELPFPADCSYQALSDLETQTRSQLKEVQISLAVKKQSTPR